LNTIENQKHSSCVTVFSYRDSRHNFFFVNPNFATPFQKFKIQPTLAHNLAAETWGNKKNLKSLSCDVSNNLSSINYVLHVFLYTRFQRLKNIVSFNLWGGNGVIFDIVSRFLVVNYS